MHIKKEFNLKALNRKIYTLQSEKFLEYLYFERFTDTYSYVKVFI